MVSQFYLCIMEYIVDFSYDGVCMYAFCSMKILQSLAWGWKWKMAERHGEELLRGSELV